MAEEIRFWDVASRKLLRTWKASAGAVEFAVFSPDGDYLAFLSSYGGKNKIRVYDVRRGKQLWRTYKTDFNFTSLAYSPDGKRIVAGLNTGDESRGDGAVCVLDADTGQVQRMWKFPGSALTLVGVSAKANKIICTRNEPVSLHRKLGTFPQYKGTISTIGLGNGGSVTNVAKTNAGEVIIALATAPDGKSVATVRLVQDDTGRRADCKVSITDVRTGRSRWTRLVSFENPGALSFSPDGQTLVGVGPGPNIVKFWDVRTGRQRLRLSRQSGFGTVAYSPDGKFIAGAHGRSIKITRAP
jgi:WD40 repeat protein